MKTTPDLLGLTRIVIITSRWFVAQIFENLNNTPLMCSFKERMYSYGYGSITRKI